MRWLKWYNHTWELQIHLDSSEFLDESSKKSVQIFHTQIFGISHVHIKDHLRGDGGFMLCLIGEGVIPIKEIVKTLESDGYSGYMSLECEKKWHPHNFI